MNPALRVLHLEDNTSDTELVQATFEAEGIRNVFTRVETEDDFVAALKGGDFDIILADYTLPSFDGLSALKIAQELTPDVPFLFVSGTLGEDVAIEALKRGAIDYVLKTRLVRLGPSVIRALREARERAERKRAEEALRRSEKELRDVINTVPANIWSASPDGAVDFINQRWREFTGLLSEDALGWNWEKAIHPDDRTWSLTDWRKALENGQSMESEIRIRRADGEHHWFFVRNVPLRDEHGNIVKWYGAAIDVEDRKRAEEQVRRSEAYLAEAQRLTHTGSRAHKPGMSKPFYWSEEMFRILGFDQEKGLPDNETVWQRVHPEDLNGFMQEQIDKLSGGDLRTDIANDYRIVLPDGTVKYIHGRSHPVFDETGKVIEYIGTSVDVTERKRAEALQAGEKQLLEMIATGVPLQKILNDLCCVIEEQRPGTLASVLMLNPDGVHLKVVAGPNLPQDWTHQMEDLPIGPCAGSCGTAAYRAAQVIVPDIASDPLWDLTEHRASALKHGLRASWSNPVFSSQGKVLGTFCIYHREPRSPSSQDLELIELATHLTRVAIERDRAEEALRMSEQLARSHVDVMMSSLDVLATEATPEKFIAEMLRTIGQRLSAQSVLLWLCDRTNDSLRLNLVIEGDQQVAPHLDHPFIEDPLEWKRSHQFQEMFFTKGPVVCDDIEHDPRIGEDFREYLIKRGRKKFMAIPMFVLGDVRGFIGIEHGEGGGYRAQEIELAQALAHHVMMAARSAELSEQRRHAVVLEERTRMARDIHDTLAQGFTGVIIQLDAAVEALRDEEPEGAAKHISRARELARESLSEARRSVHALRPQALEKAAFPDALKAIIQNAAAGTSLRADFELEGEPCQLSTSVEENLLRIGQEALTNVLKHAHATEFRVRLSFGDSAVRLELRDNGDGFVVDAVHGAGFGLLGMKERAEQIGATLTVLSEPGAGTDIVAVSQYQHS